MTGPRILSLWDVRITAHLLIIDIILSIHLIYLIPVSEIVFALMCTKFNMHLNFNLTASIFFKHLDPK
jgi:hypothetical protein